MTRKEREAAEAVEIEAAIQRTNEECDAEIDARAWRAPAGERISNHEPSMDAFELSIEQAIALPKGHPARFLRLYGTRTGRMSFAAATPVALSEARIWRWRIFGGNPFASDLAYCAETNS